MKREWSMVNGECSMLRRAVMIVCLLMCTGYSFAQKISTILSKDKIVIGEQVSLRIEIEGIAENSVLKDFDFPDTINHIEILSDSIESEGSSYIHTLTLTSFDSGYWQFPAFELALADNRKLASEPVDITVLPADISHLVDYHDIKDILDIPLENNWWVIAAIVVTGLLSLFALLWFVTNKTPAPGTSIPKTDLSILYTTLLKKLQAFESADLSDRQAVIDLFKESSAGIRSFTDAVYQQNNMHFTTGEYIVQVKGNLPDVETENNYFQFLRLADAVKFARYLPPAEETRAVFPLLRKFAEQVYQQNKMPG